VFLLEPRIVPFVTLAADFVQAAQRGGVELKNGSSPAVYSGKYIGIVTLVRGSEVGIGAKNYKIKKTGASACANAPVCE